MEQINHIGISNGRGLARNPCSKLIMMLLNSRRAKRMQPWLKHIICLYFHSLSSDSFYGYNQLRT